MKEYLLLDQPGAIKALGHPLRIKLINILSREQASVGQLAQHLQIPHAQLFYHVKELEKHGLVEVVGTRIINGIQEKFYRAVAQTFFLGQSAGNLPRDAIQAASGAVQDNLRRWRRRQVLQVDIANLAGDIIHDILQLKPGQKVLITGQKEVLDFCHALEVQCRIAGGEGLVQAVDLPSLAQMLRETKLEFLEQLPPLTRELSLICDYIIYFYPVLPDNFLSDVPREKLRAAKGAEHRLQSIANPKLILIAYPQPELARQHNLDYQPMFDSFWQGIAISQQDLVTAASRLKGELEHQLQFTLTCPAGTRLHVTRHSQSNFRIVDKGLSRDRDNLGANLTLPAGQLILRGIAISGTVHIPVHEHQDSIYTDVRITLDNNRITWCNIPELQQFLAQLAADNISFGLNPGIGNICIPTILAGLGPDNLLVNLAKGQDESVLYPLLVTNYSLSRKEQLT